MKRIAFLFLATVASSTFVGCGNDKKEDPAPAKSRTELLMAKSWMLTAETETTGTGAPTNTYNDYESYEKDNIYKFQANSVFVMDEGATREDPNDPTTVNGAWALSDTDKNITYQVGFFGTGLLSNNQKGEIEELTDSQLVVKMVYNYGGVAITTRQTFTAK